MCRELGGDLEKNFLVEARTDPRDSPGSQSGVQERQGPGARRWELAFLGNLGGGLGSGQQDLIFAC